uniref:Receptor-like serine/threonine-protein kinase NCRK isoform X1 n=1 Tax=Rhizophora mucronata TaxID=61149 RepID=A0A2P2IIT8_RHIMU
MPYVMQMAAISSLTTEPCVIRAGGRAEDFDVDEPGQNPSSRQKAQNPLPLEAKHTVSVGSKDGELHIVSTEYIEGLIVLSSDAKSCRASDDEAVDLTEPRFESFSNVKSP